LAAKRPLTFDESSLPLRLVVSLSSFRQSCELRAGGVDDPDASRAATVLAAYFDAEQARAWRRVVWRAVAVGGLAGWILSVTTSVLTPVDLVLGAGLLGAPAITSAPAEWRARKKLGTLIA
jgi:hypothetical protein